MKFRSIFVALVVFVGMVYAMEYVSNWINIKPDNPSAVVPAEGVMFWNTSSQQVNVYDANLQPVGLDGRQDCDYLVYTNGTHYFAKNCSSGIIEFEGTSASAVLQALDGTSNNLKIVVKSNITIDTQVVFENTSYLELDFMGHTVFNNVGLFNSFINYRTNDGVFIVRNVIVDNQNTAGDGITAGATGIYPKLIILKNVEVKNFTNHGFYFRVAPPDVGVNEDEEHDIILENVRAISNGSSLNECLTIDNARRVIIENSEFIGNKIFYIVASQVFVKNFMYNTTNWGGTTRARYISYRNVIARGTGNNAYLDILPYISVEGIYQFDDNYFTEIRGFRGDCTACRIKLRPYNDTYVLKHVVIDGITQRQTPIHIEPFANMDYATIETLEVRNVKFLEYSFLYVVLYDINVNIKNLLIDGIEMPGISQTYTRVIYVKNDKANREVNAVIRSVTWGLPYIGQSDDNGAGYGVTGVFDVNPILYKNFWQLTNGTSQPRLLRNSGSTIVSGASLVLIPHGLAGEPNVVTFSVNESSVQPCWVASKDATNINITCSASGTFEVYWYAEYKP